MTTRLICNELIFECKTTTWYNIREYICRTTHKYIINYRNDFFKFELNVSNNNIIKDDTINDDNSIDTTDTTDDNNIINNYISFYNCINKTFIYKNINLFIKDINVSEFTKNLLKFNNIEGCQLQYLRLYIYYLDLLTLIDVSGIYALINKDENNGYYSIGNSTDIYKLLILINTYFDDEDEYMKNNINEILSIFNHSIQENSVVVLSSSISVERNNNVNILNTLYKYNKIVIKNNNIII